MRDGFCFHQLSTVQQLRFPLDQIAVIETVKANNKACRANCKW